MLAAVASAATAEAQSARPGWGSTPYHNASGTGVTFRVWAPNATSVYVPGTFNNWSTTATPLVQERTNGAVDGIWSADVAGVTNGSHYKYYINNNGAIWKHDPRSRWVTAAGTASGADDLVYDPTAFNWSGDSLTPPSLNDLFIYELHMGTFPSSSAPNRFIAATNKLDYLRSLGANVVELMPIAGFGNSGSSWGYDPAQLFAVDNSQYGGPDGFKTFVQACHARGIAVMVDVVHNHYGTGLLDMWNFDGWSGTNSLGGGGIYFYESNTNLQITPWGYTRPNFSSQQVADFVQDNFTLWLSEYHVDGFRWDTPSTMMHGNDGSYITAAGNLITAINAMMHTNYSGKISIAEDVYNAFGFDSAWDTSYPYKVTPVLTNTADAGRDMTAIANAVKDNVRYGGLAGSGRVAFLESHDVVGDLNGGVRLVTAIDPATPNSYRARKLSTLGAAVALTAPGVPMIFQGQEMLENQAFDSSLPVDWTKTNTYSRIVQFYRDLISTRRDLKGYTPGLEGDQCSVYQVDNVNKLVAFHRWKSAATNQDVVVVANFANATRSNYSLNFPSAGNWYVHFNSDSTNYGSDYGNVGSSVVTAGGSPASAGLTIGPYSALILSQTPDVPPQLMITPTNGAVTISWPNSYSGWVLAASTSLTGNPAWVQVPSAQYQTNATSVFINASVSGSNTFYRLQAP
ncbi:MAG TPA: alpha-amylase family glycosyl hydrolase [Candidatus Binatia bacterium]|jgi:1,4-alpha-glucan branching enzyme|nr:alpha-amylase family glycosyl hydrolase [Candidatus Binatia bacterium]